MARWIRRRRQPERVGEYRAEARSTRDDILRERFDLAVERARGARDIRALFERVESTDSRVSESIEALRRARTTNHFTDRARALMEGSLKHG